MSTLTYMGVSDSSPGRLEHSLQKVQLTQPLASTTTTSSYNHYIATTRFSPLLTNMLTDAQTRRGTDTKSMTDTKINVQRHIETTIHMYQNYERSFSHEENVTFSF